MQKKLIALAVAAVASGAAFADTNVTVYGVVDLTQESVKASGSTTTNQGILSRGRLQSNSSHVGFKGSEDLGNGLKAVFQIETTVNADAGGFGDGRDTYVGLAGGFGTVLLGNLTHAARTLGVVSDFNPGATGIGFDSMTGEFAGVKTGADNRAANAIAYVSPSFGGFTAYGAYVNGENRSAEGAATGFNQKSYQIAATYGVGGLLLGAGYHKAVDLGASLTAAGANAADDATVQRLMAKYSFGQGTTIAALWDRTKLEGTVGTKRTAWKVGANQAFGASNVYLQYGKAGDLSGGVLADSSSGAKQVTLGYTYNLSKRTMLKAVYSKITNESAGRYDYYHGAVGIANVNTGGTAGVGADPVGFGVGLRHSF